MRNQLMQSLAITLSSLRSIPERRTSSLVAITGIAGVVAILVGILSMREGFRATLDSSAANDVAVVLRRGADSEMTSGLGLDHARQIADATASMGNPKRTLVSPELYIVVDAPLRATGTLANAPLRGVGPNGPALRRHFKLLSGRMFTPGKFEIIVGRGAAAEFRGLDVGDRVHWGSNDWQVVGVFADAGGISESEIWADVAVLQNAYNRLATFQSIRVKLSSPAQLQSLERELDKNPQLNIRVMTEAEYYAEQSRTLSKLIADVGYTVGFLMGLGAIFGALNTMYTAVAARRREIATLRAIGFGALPVISSVVGESLLLGLIGGGAGCLIAYWAFNGIQASTVNFASFSQVAFSFKVTAALLWEGLLYSLVLAFVGGLLPSWRAARMPIVTGLREI